jgi:hypothetical protein
VPASATTLVSRFAASKVSSVTVVVPAAPPLVALTDWLIRLPAPS